MFLMFPLADENGKPDREGVIGDERSMIAAQVVEGAREGGVAVRLLADPENWYWGSGEEVSGVNDWG